MYPSKSWEICISCHLSSEETRNISISNPLKQCAILKRCLIKSCFVLLIIRLHVDVCHMDHFKRRLAIFRRLQAGLAQCRTGPLTKQLAWPNKNCNTGLIKKYFLILYIIEYYILKRIKFMKNITFHI